MFRQQLKGVYQIVTVGIRVEFWEEQRWLVYKLIQFSQTTIMHSAASLNNMCTLPVNRIGYYLINFSQNLLLRVISEFKCQTKSLSLKLYRLFEECNFNQSIIELRIIIILEKAILVSKYRANLQFLGIGGLISEQGNT